MAGQGAATPRLQPGNPRPRLFRLTEDRAVINRFGFNNDGAEAIRARLALRPGSLPIGLNLGANKDSVGRAADFARVLALCGPEADFATVIVSSPNTERLRGLQGRAALSALLAGVIQVRVTLPRPILIFLKIAPDLDDAACRGRRDRHCRTGPYQDTGRGFCRAALHRDGVRRHIPACPHRAGYGRPYDKRRFRH
jgi:dihydroorotate dehydrogenase